MERSRILISSMTIFFELITFLGSWKVITALAFAAVVMMTVRRMSFRTIIAFLTAVILGEAIVLLLKNLLQFPRPDTPDGAFMMAEGDYSFPSGHTFMAMVFYGFVATLLSKNIDNKPLCWGLNAAFILLIFLIGFSRWYLGFHFAGEVMGSWVLGALWLVLIVFFLDRK